MEPRSDPPDLAPSWLDRLAGLWPERVALIDTDNGAEYRYSDLRERSLRTAATLAAHGVQPGDRVAAVLPNGVVVLDLLFACARLGAILVPLNWRLSGRELGALLSDAAPRCLVLDPAFADLTRPYAPSGTAIVHPAHLAAGDTDNAPAPAVLLSDPWLILYTGGTTGRPKGAVLHHGAILANAVNTAISWGLSEGDVAPTFTPMYHTGGLNVFTLPLLLLGGRLLIPRQFEPAAALSLLATYRPTVLFLVPTMFGRLAEQPGFADADLSSLRWVISGGAPLPERVAEQWAHKVRLFKQGYGLTEVGPNNFATPDSDTVGKQGTVGRLTLFARARIVTPQGVDVAPGEVGELLLAGPHMCSGYWRRPEETAATIRAGWFWTGDLARRDADGYYYIAGRAKDMIISGGENIYPSEVEAVLYEHDDVREAVVVGVPDPLWGEAVCAVVSLKKGAFLAPDTLRAFVRERLAHYKSPKEILVVDDVPKSGADKIVRAQALALFDRHV